MEVEFTARQVKISKVLKSDAAEGIERIALVLGKITSAAITFRAERHLQIVDLALKGRQYSIVSSGEAVGPTSTCCDFKIPARPSCSRL